MRLPSPTNDAKWCLEQLFQYMEMNLKNRVEAKTGRATSLELNKLSNLMANAGLAHPSKVRSIMSPSRLKRVEGAITVTPEQRVALREVFIFYCGWAEKHNYTYMSCSQFLRFCRDTFIMCGDLDATTLTLMFEKVHLESPDQAPGTRITMTDWIQALMLIALQSMPALPPQEAWEKLVYDHVLMFGAKVACNTDRLATIMLQSDVIKVLGHAKSKFKPVFKHYVNDQAMMVPQARLRRPLPSVASTIHNLSRPMSAVQPDTLASCLPLPLPQLQPATLPRPSQSQSQPQAMQNSMSGSTLLTNNARSPNRMSMVQQDLEASMVSLSGAAQNVLDSTARKLQGLQNIVPPSTAASTRSQTQLLQRARALMPLATFLRFLQDFDVMPKLINKSQATQCFRAARFGPGHEQEDGADLARIDFAEFMDAMGRCALVAYNFQIKAEPEKLLAFEDSYHPGAKHLWSTRAREALEDSLAFPDEVLVPSADRAACIGGEDSPHYDDTVQSRWGEDDGVATAARLGAPPATARSTKSQAIFRTARSLANCRAKQTLNKTASGNGGAEVMQMHAQADHLDMGRPLHLRHFPPTWIGEQRPTFAETNTARRRATNMSAKLGIYTADVGVPPKFADRAAAMIDARIMREQALEALKLMYVSQRRLEQRERDAEATQRRRTLQLAAGQQTMEAVASPDELALFA